MRTEEEDRALGLSLLARFQNPHPLLCRTKIYLTSRFIPISINAVEFEQWNSSIQISHAYSLFPLTRPTEAQSREPDLTRKNEEKSGRPISSVKRLSRIKILFLGQQSDWVSTVKKLFFSSSFFFSGLVNYRPVLT